MDAQQLELFSTREVAQFGVTAKPMISIAPATTLRLEMQDPRTPEERERDNRKDIERQTHTLPEVH